VLISTVWNVRYALRTLRMKGSSIRELLKITHRPDLISFCWGLPAPDVFPSPCRVEEYFPKTRHRQMPCSDTCCAPIEH